jgi:hypothetical protein
MGIEDLWGNRATFVDGLYQNSSYVVTVADVTNPSMSFNGSGSGYKSVLTRSWKSANYISQIGGTNETGFIATAVSGSATTYYCDKGSFAKNAIFAFGGHSGLKNDAGIFFNSDGVPDTYSSSFYGTRLCYCG